MPLYDEETGKLAAGIRLGQIDKNKPMRYTLFEPEGFTKYINDGGDIQIIDGKVRRKYKNIMVTDFINAIFEIAGIDDVPTYARNQIQNGTEEMQRLVLAENNLPESYIQEKMIALLGDAERLRNVSDMSYNNSITNAAL